MMTNGFSASYRIEYPRSNFLHLLLLSAAFIAGVRMADEKAGDLKVRVVCGAEKAGEKFMCEKRIIPIPPSSTTAHPAQRSRSASSKSYLHTAAIIQSR